MTIYLKVSGNLKKKLTPNMDEHVRKVEVEQGLTLKEILKQLGIPVEQVAFAHVEGRFRRLDYFPEDGQVITLQPHIAGG